MLILIVAFLFVLSGGMLVVSYTKRYALDSLHPADGVLLFRQGNGRWKMRKRHTEAEIAILLDQAQEMADQGKLHRYIAKSLGVSLMTYHRWRKARAENHCASPPVEVNRIDALARRDEVKRIGELKLENSRLRDIVANLLLEKMALEESQRGNRAIHRMVGHA
jgi:hypothetical protein